jgi:hypothetical protein
MGLLGKILKTGLDVVTTPVEIIKDVATMGGAVNGEDEPYTKKHLRQLGEDVEEIRDECDKL